MLAKSNFHIHFTPVRRSWMNSRTRGISQDVWTVALFISEGSTVPPRSNPLSPTAVRRQSRTTERRDVPRPPLGGIADQLGGSPNEKAMTSVSLRKPLTHHLWERHGTRTAATAPCTLTGCRTSPSRANGTSTQLTQSRQSSHIALSPDVKVCLNIDEKVSFHTQSIGCTWSVAANRS